MVHSFYSSNRPSGENTVVEAEIGALQRAGHDVELFDARTDELSDDPLYQIRSALRVATGRGRNPLGALEAFAPEVVHIHNLFPNWARRWVLDLDRPIVHTLHNYRPLCANGYLYRDGHVCTLCPDGQRWAGVRHACYRGSRSATLPIAIANRKGPSGDPLLERVDRIIVLSRVQRDLYAEAGQPMASVVQWPNFLPSSLDPGSPPRGTDRAGWLAVGRLTPEKGLLELAQNWPEDEPLTIVGDGEQRTAIAEAGRGKDIALAGHISRSRVIELMRSSLGLVFPSRSYEAFPLIYPEALASGLPVVAFEPNALADLVTRDGTGLRSTWDDDLKTVLTAARSRFSPAIRVHCRVVFENTYSETAYLQRAEALYREVLETGTRKHRSTN